MPTGYTAAVQSGEVTDFSAFVLRCARNFGALIELRDDSLDMPIPAELPGSQYHNTRLAEVQARLASLKAATNEELQFFADKEYQEAVESYDAALERKRVERERYEAMLIKVGMWEPPTPDHVGLKDFMASQLAESISWDCSTEYYVNNPPQHLTAGEWAAKERERLGKEITYHTHHQAADDARTTSRNEWLRKLRESLGK